MRDCKKKLGLRDLIQTNDSDVAPNDDELTIQSVPSRRRKPVSLFDIHKIYLRERLTVKKKTVLIDPAK